MNISDKCRMRKNLDIRLVVFLFLINLVLGLASILMAEPNGMIVVTLWLLILFILFYTYNYAIASNRCAGTSVNPLSIYGLSSREWEIVLLLSKKSFNSKPLGLEGALSLDFSFLESLNE